MSGVWSGTWGTGTQNITTGAIDAATGYAIITTSVDGNQTITTNGNLTSPGANIWATTTGKGANVITANGTLTKGQYGVFSTTLSGNNTVTTNALVDGTIDGIYAAALGGNVTVTNNAAVKSSAGGAFTAGIVTITLGGTGNTTVNANADSTGTNAGIYTINNLTGTATVNIAKGVNVYGTNFGVVTQNGTNVVNNAGLITTTPDFNAALGSVGPTGAGWSLYMWAGANTTVNNTGTITGILAADTGTNALNNAASGVINLRAVSQTFNSAINNAGLINVYAGNTALLFTSLNNKSGGIIDLTKNSAITDTLTVMNFSAQSGSHIVANLNVNAALGAEDRGTTGNSDTIFVVAGKSTPTGGSLVDYVQTGGDATALTGSVALVYTGKVLAAPNPGDTLTQSANYLFGTGNPNTGARKYALVDDAQGGVYLQWTPNITSATMGAFGGGDANDPNGRASASAAMKGSLSGATSAIALIANQGGADAANQCLTGGKRRFLWSSASAGGSSFTGGSGSDFGGAIGIEGALGGNGKSECGRTSLGAFVYGNTARTTFVSGSNRADGYGVGGYIRTATASGIYANLLGTAGATGANIANNIFKSTAHSNAFVWLVNATLGITRPLGSGKSLFDLRASGTYANSTTGRIKDSLGFIIDRMRTRMTALEATAGITTPVGAKTALYLRGGAKYVKISQYTSAFGVGTKASGSDVYGTGELGLRSNLSDRSQVQLSGYGDFGGQLKSYGGRISLRYAF